MQQRERRQNTRARCTVPVILDSPRGRAHRHLVCLSDDGAFVPGVPDLRLGDRATLRFTDPGSRHPVVSRGIVARTVPGPNGGVGFFLVDPVSRVRASQSEKRSSERHVTKLKAELEVGGRPHFCRIIDLGIAGACIETRVRLAPGYVGRLRFAHPVTGASATARIHAAWRAVPTKNSPGWFRQGFRLIDSLPALAQDPHRGSGDLPRSDIVLPTSDRTMDDVRTHELVMRKLLRGVMYRGAMGQVRRGRLVLASAKTALIAGVRPPQVGDRTPMALETPEGSGFAPLRFLAQVERSGPRLVAGNEAGCVISIVRFQDPTARRRWAELTKWLVQRTR